MVARAAAVEPAPRSPTGSRPLIVPNGPLGTGLAINMPGRTVEHSADLATAVAEQRAPRVGVVGPVLDIEGADQPLELPGYRLLDSEHFAGVVELSASVFERAP